MSNGTRKLRQVKKGANEKDKGNSKNGRSALPPAPDHIKAQLANQPAASLKGPVLSQLTLAKAPNGAEKKAPEPKEPEPAAPPAANGVTAETPPPPPPEPATKEQAAPALEVVAAEETAAPTPTAEAAAPPVAEPEKPTEPKTAETAPTEAGPAEAGPPPPEKAEPPRPETAPKAEADKPEKAAGPQNEEAKAGPEPAAPAPAGEKTPQPQAGETTPAGKAPDAGGEASAAMPPATAEAAPGEALTPTAEPAAEKKEGEKTAEAAPAEGKKEGEGAAEAGGEGEKEETIERAPTSPEEDPAFQSTVQQVRRTKRKQSDHKEADVKQEEVKVSAVLPEEEQKKKNARKDHLETMNTVAEKKEQEGQPITADTFKEKLQDSLKQIEKSLPKSESAAKKFKREKPLGLVGKGINALVQKENEKVSAPIANQIKIKEPPPSDKTPDPQKELVEEKAGKAPRPISAPAAAAKPKTDPEISMQKESQSLDDKMTEYNMTEQQLADSNEPEFLQALETKKEAQKQAAEAPGRYREQEQQILSTAQAKAGKTGRKGFGSMHGSRDAAFTGVFGRQGTNKTDDETKQKEVNKELETIYNQTKEDVDKKLKGLTESVDNIFESKVKEAQESFEKRVEDQLDDIYGFTVIDDWLFGEDTEAIEGVFAREKERFVNTMDTVLTNIANLIATELNGAIDLIKGGRKKAQDFFDGLTETQQKLASKSMEFFNAQYDMLEDTVRETEQELAYNLAESYKQSVSNLRESFDKIKEDVSKGWIGKAADFIVSVGKAIYKLSKLLYSVLSRMVHIIGDILAHPIRFLETLAAGIVSGFTTFIKKIDTYLISGFFDWLRGSLGGGPIHIPEKLDGAGLFSLTTQILDLNYDTFREIAVRKFGEKPVAALEKGVEIAGKGLELFQLARTKGLGALWANVKEMIVSQLDQIFDKVKETVLYATIEKALKYVAGLFTPAGGFIKAAQTLYRGLRFLVDNIDRIADLVNAFLDSLELAAQGNKEGIAKKVVEALRVFIVIAIDFLAKILGLGKLADKVRRIIKAIRRPIIRAFEWLLNKLKPAVLKIHGFGEKIVGKAKAGVKKGVGKLKDLLFPIRRFIVGTTSHAMEVQQTGSGDHIIVRSSPKRIPEVVIDARKHLKKKPDAKLEKKVDKLDDAYSAWRRMSTKTDADRKKKSATYLAIYKQTVKILTAIDSDDAVPMSKITWDPLDKRGRAKGVTANPLTVKGPKGETPQETIPGYNPKDEKAQIKAHLLHHSLHGPGRRFNMTPTSRSINGKMLHHVEKHALEELGIKPEDTAKQESVKLAYTTKVTYDSTDPKREDVAKNVKMNVEVKDIKTNKKIKPIPPFNEDNYP